MIESWRGEEEGKQMGETEGEKERSDREAEKIETVL